jgi:SpoVK/Ycf46/Vps4 family AAA+-type ATPase
MDSAVLRDNVIFFATTNHPHEIPENIIDRPSRLDLLLGVFHEDNDPSYVPKFYEHLMGEDCPIDMSSSWIHQAHKELSPAYMKEMFIHSKVLGVPVEEGYKKLKRRRQLVRNGFKRGADMGF